MSEIILKKGKLSSTLLRGLVDYYAAIPGVDKSYVTLRWDQWKQGDNIAVYLLKKDEEPVGWIIYNRATSTIEEILLNPDKDQALVRFQAIDALIDRESLLSAEILEEDTEKFYWLGEYGFRPTRKI